MTEKQIPIISSTKQSKIVRFKLEQECVELRKSGLSLQEIADELNRNPKIPVGDSIDKFVVSRFLDKMPDISRQLIQEDKRRLLDVVNTNFDILNEVNEIYGKSKQLLQLMDEAATNEGRHINPYQYKAVISEMREMLGQMMAVQKEINDFNNIKKFMEIILLVLKEECPEKIPIIAEKLRMAKGTQWFADLINRS